MKKILKIFAITSLIMLLLMGVAAFFAYRSYNQEEKEKKEVTQEELDMQVYGITKEDVSVDKVFPLYLSKDKKNVETYSYKSANDIYNVKNSKKVKASLENLKKKNKYTVDNCLWAYNPFGTHELSLYLYFETKELTMLRYTVHVENEDIPDFTRSAMVEDSVVGKKGLECTISGLVPGVENFIILKLQDESGTIVKRVVYSITPPRLKGTVQNQLSVIDGPSLTNISNGLYLFFGHDTENKKMDRAIYLYDNSGILRGAIPIINNQANRVIFIEDTMFYNYSNERFARVSSFGQVLKTYRLKSYKTVNDYTYDGFGNILTIATKTKGKAVEDQIVSLNLETGKTTPLVSMGDLLKKVKQKSKNSSDWIGLNSIIWAGKDSVILSARNLSGIIKVTNISSVKPSIQYIIGDASLWKGKVKSTKILPKYVADTNTDAVNTEPFISQYGQSTVTLSPVDEQYPSNDSQYYLTMFNNNYNKEKAQTSYFYKFFVDELAGTYDLAKSFEVPYSTYESSIQEYAGNIIVNSGTDCSVCEYDTQGILIQELKYNVETFTYRVFKEDFKNFWFS